MLEQQRQTVTGRSSGLTGTSQSGSLIVEVACDDRQTQLAVQGSDTVAEVRRAALAEMQILTTDPNKYVVIGAGRQPVRDQRTMDELLARVRHSTSGAAPGRFRCDEGGSWICLIRCLHSPTSIPSMQTRDDRKVLRREVCRRVTTSFLSFRVLAVDVCWPDSSAGVIRDCARTCLP